MEKLGDKYLKIPVSNLLFFFLTVKERISRKEKGRTMDSDFFLGGSISSLIIVMYIILLFYYL